MYPFLIKILDPALYIITYTVLCKYSLCDTLFLLSQGLDQASENPITTILHWHSHAVGDITFSHDGKVSLLLDKIAIENTNHET